MDKGAQIEACAEAFQKWGVRSQLEIAMEECGELIVAISHYVRGRPGADRALADEVADVELCCQSIRLLLDHDVDAIKVGKWRRLRERLDASPPPDTEG